MYSSIVLALAAVFTGAQQSLSLPSQEFVAALDADGINKIKTTFSSSWRTSPEPSFLALFAWQIPLMLLGHAVFSFLVGFCAVILSPLAMHSTWSDEAKGGTLPVHTLSQLTLLTSCRYPWYSSSSLCSHSYAGYSPRLSCIV